MPVPAQGPPVTIPTTSGQAPNVEIAVKEALPQALPTTATPTPTHHSLPPSILTPPPTVEMSPGLPKKRKRTHIHLANYLDDDAKRPSRRSRRLHNYRTSPYKYSKTQEDDD